MAACSHWFHLSVISILAGDDVLSRERAENPPRQAEQFLPVNIRTTQYTEGLKSMVQTALSALAFITN